MHIYHQLFQKLAVLYYFPFQFLSGLYRRIQLRAEGNARSKSYLQKKASTSPSIYSLLRAIRTSSISNFICYSPVYSSVSEQISVIYYNGILSIYRTTHKVYIYLACKIGKKKFIMGSNLNPDNNHSLFCFTCPSSAFYMGCKLLTC